MKIASTIKIASIYFVLIRFLIWILQANFDSIANQINFHYSNSVNWYLIWWGIPIVFSIFISIKFPNRLFQISGTLFLPVLFIGNIWGGIENKSEFGFFFRRPAIFKECKKATKINSISFYGKSEYFHEFSLSPDSSFLRYFQRGQSNYYQTRYRFLNTFYDNQEPNFKLKIDTLKTITLEDFEIIKNLINIDNEIAKNGNGQVFGNITDFATSNKEYYYLTIADLNKKSENYFFREWLIEKENKNRIIKSQKFLWVFDGPFEPPEYTYLVGILEFICLLPFLVIATIIITLEKK